MASAVTTEKAKAKTPKKRNKKDAPPDPRGLAATQILAPDPSAPTKRLAACIQEDGGVVIGLYRDPLGGNWQVLAGLPLERVEPTPYQRDLSPAHVKRMSAAIDKLDRYLDPVITFRTEDGTYWTPNGHHRTAAMRELGAKSITALVVGEREVAHRILLLNTEKAHNLRERALEVMRLAKGLAELEPSPEREFEAEFEEPSLLTLGYCYEERGRFAGGAFHPILRRIDRFLDLKLPKALEVRRDRASRLLELETFVNEAVKSLKQRGLESPYLKAFVVARINPLRFKRGAKTEFDETIDKMRRSAKSFDAGKVRADQLARASGPPDE